MGTLDLQPIKSEQTELVLVHVALCCGSDVASAAMVRCFFGVILLAGFRSLVTATGLTHPRFSEFQTCTSFFLDLGANIGVQGRRFYENDKFPKRGVLNALFKQHFGSPDNRSHVCTFAFEPNPRHAPRLREMEAVYQSLGYRYYFFPYAVSTLDTTFQLTKPNSDTQMAASLEKDPLKKSGRPSVTVQVIDFLAFLQHLLLSKEKDNKKGRVLCKMDIEGEEYNLLPALISSGLICLIDTISVEYHLSRAPNFRSGFLQLYKRAELAEFQSNVSHYIDKYSPRRPCHTVVKRSDDELYHDDSLLTNPLPLFKGASPDCQNVSRMCILSEPVEGMSLEQYKDTIFGIKRWA
jgi:FkbM family methyltransferase